MPSADLIQQLHRLFSKPHSSYSSLALAAETGVSPSELQPVLVQLKEEYKAPLQYSNEGRTYRYNPDKLPFELPGLTFTNSELRGLATVLSMLKDLNPGHSSRELNQLQAQMGKLMQEGGLNPEDLKHRIRILSTGRRVVNPQIYQQVTDALFARKQLNIHYVAADQSLSERAISPQTLVYYRDSWYLDAWCHKREQLRTFMLGRINSAYQLSDVAKEFDQAQLEDHFHNSYGIFSGDEEHTAQLIFLPGAAHLVAQQQWHPDAKGHWKGDEYHISLPYNDQRELLRDLLSYAPNVIITAPDDLKAAYRKRLQEALSRNM